MQVLHTIHPVGDYSELQQHVHTFEHNDLELAYYEINYVPVGEERVIGSDTIVTPVGLFTTHSSLVESYVIVDGQHPELFEQLDAVEVQL